MPMQDAYYTKCGWGKQTEHSWIFGTGEYLSEAGFIQNNSNFMCLSCVSFLCVMFTSVCSNKSVWFPSKQSVLTLKTSSPSSFHPPPPKCSCDMYKS